MPRFALDPRWITARFASDCSNSACRKPIRKGARIFYFPNGKKAVCEECGAIEAARFQASGMDEDIYNRRDIY